MTFIAWTLPFGFALARASSHAQWRGDIAAVRDIALGGVGWGGGLSTCLTQIALFVPLGSQTFRAALISCIAIAVAARAIHALAMRMLRRAEDAQASPPSRFAAPTLATIATLLATMTPSFQSEATVGGSTMLAVALCLVLSNRALAAVGREPLHSGHRALVSIGFLLGAVTAENAIAAFVTLVAVGVAVFFAPDSSNARASTVLVPRRVIRWMIAAWLAGLALLSLPSVLRIVAPNAVVDFGGPYLWGSVLPPDVSPRHELLAAFANEIGWVGLAMVAVGAATLLVRRRTWIVLVSPVLVVAADFGLHRLVGATDGAVALRLLAIAWCASVSTVGVHAFFNRLVRARIPLARAGAALVVAFQATIVALTIEQASETANRAASLGADQFTDLAFDRLPAQPAVFVTNPRITWRLLAASLVEGRRRDALIVPRSLLGRGDTATRLLVRERQTEPLLRVVALTGTADEFALTEIADVRPLFVEPERGWGPHEYAHCTVGGAWVRYAPEPLGPTDRKLDVESTLAELAPILRTVEDEPGDGETGAVVKAAVTAQAKTLLKLNDLKNANHYLTAVDNPGARVSVSGSLDVAFAAEVARLPANRAQRDRDKEHEKLRQAERKKGESTRRKR